ncbi:mitochondrial coenzyme A diphosphatase NUDT8-like [Ptychodera flava]|uniref:mitochondrial coenzyme A diphosphatase NUDT8-like n=1 Tax=Ptychodera flava TaxID=63121 RepID=UPI00396AADB0
MTLNKCTSLARLSSLGKTLARNQLRILNQCSNRNIGHARAAGKPQELYLRSIPIEHTHRHFSTSTSAFSSLTLDKALIDLFSKENKSIFVNRMKHIKPLRTLTKEAVQQGAVCIPLCVVDGQPAILYTLRSNQLVTHRGEVSFPGGMADKRDENVTHTALRELEEELGIDASTVEVWGSLIPLPDKTRKTAVTPIVGFLGDVNISALKPNSDEVEETFVMTVKQLCTPEYQKYTTFIVQGQADKTYCMPVFLGGPYRIWGLTAIATDQVLRAMLPGIYKPAAVSFYGRKG